MSGHTPDSEELRIRSRLRELVDGTVHPQPPADAVTAAAATALASAAQPSAPAALQPSAQPAAARSDDWWDRIYDDEQPAPAAQPASRRPSWMRIPDWRTGEHVDLDKKDDDPAEDAEDQDADEDDPDADDTDGDGDGDEDEEQPDSGGTADAQPRSRSRTRKTAPPRTRRSRSRTAPRAGLDVELPRRSLLDAYDAIPPRIRWLNLHLSAAAAGYALGWVDYSTRTYAWIAQHGLLNLSTAFWCAVAVGCELLRRRARNLWLPARWLAAVPIASIVVGTLLYGTGWNELDLPL